MWLQLDRFKAYMQELEGVTAVWVMLLCSSAVALAYNIVHYLLLQRTSSITVTVLGEVKIVGLLCLSAVILPGAAKRCLQLDQLPVCHCSLQECWRELA